MRSPLMSQSVFTWILQVLELTPTERQLPVAEAFVPSTLHMLRMRWYVCVSDDMFASWKSSLFHSLSIEMFVIINVVSVYMNRVQSLLRNSYVDLGRCCGLRRKPIERRGRSSRISSVQSLRRQGCIPSWALTWIHCLPLSHPPMLSNPTASPDMLDDMGLLHGHPVHCLPF